MSNELGAGNAGRARRVMAVALKLATLVAIAVILALIFGNSVWAGFFSDSPVIVGAFSSMTPLLAVSILLDFIQGILSGGLYNILQCYASVVDLRHFKVKNNEFDGRLFLQG